MNEEENSFYYKNLYELTLCSGKIAENSERFQRELFGHYVHYFQILKKDNVFRDDIDDAALQSLAQVIISLSTVWLQSTSTYNNDGIPRMSISVILSRLIYPYITKEYMEEFKKLCEEKNLIVLQTD